MLTGKGGRGGRAISKVGPGDRPRGDTEKENGKSEDESAICPNKPKGKRCNLVNRGRGGEPENITLGTKGKQWRHAPDRLARGAWKGAYRNIPTSLSGLECVGCGNKGGRQKVRQQVHPKATIERKPRERGGARNGNYG